MFWNKVIDLVRLENGCTEEGAPTVVEVGRTSVYANSQHVGMEKWAAARSVGLHADAAIEIRSIDYDGEQVCELDGDAYDIERVYNRGEWTNLTLKKRLGTVSASA